MLYILLFVLCILLFVFGMTIIRFALFNLSANKLKGWLIKLTSTPLKGMLTGTFITALLQSSTAVMVITIGLISARIMTFPQSIGIILGTNIGTTFKTELITFNIDKVLVPLAICGALLILFRNKKARSIGMLLFGISSVFAAMKGFEMLAVPLTSMNMINNFILSINDQILLSLLTGTIMTAIIQSSTAMTGIAMSFLTAGLLQLDAGIAIVLGANIGTCITALIASIGGGKESRLAAFAHVWLNVFGVLLFIPLIPTLTDNAPLLADTKNVQLAHISVIFNVATSLLVLPFATKFGKMILFLHDKTPKNPST
ncbi:phosphate:Na+ symporter [Bacillus sp. OV166]|uniref:Na/Pi symporter n=1 Tax=unclassified Bacillus (in: firmicutes) TaxID=185979 RepID=UPI000A2AB100|nr:MULTISPECIES: Na/Pi symporter [unclassified Bacillus (in: firmicutes)]PGY13775.1 Na/Pi cotransporter [Bacillus sp. AFS031507]SMQ82972.1 phosphate:Na+ symporter [Bacillus sp. OV166]